MPRRPFVRALTTTSATPHASSPALPPDTVFSDNVAQLRRQWKWAAFSQFFFTFAPLFNMNDITITVSVNTIPFWNYRHDSEDAVASVAMLYKRRILIGFSVTRTLKTI